MRDECKVWVCEICGANVAVKLDQSKVLLPVRPELPEECQLKHYASAGECPAFRTLKRAEELLNTAG